MEVDPELDMHLLWCVGQRAQLGDDALHCGFDPGNRVFEGLPGPFGYLGALQAASRHSMPGL